MKKLFVTLLDVFNAVINYCTSDAKKPTTDSIPALKTAVETTLDNKVVAIESLISPQNSKDAGASSQKNAYKKSAAALAMTIINPCKAFAEQNKMDSLLGKIAYSKSSLYKIKDAEFAGVVSGLMALISPYLQQLTQYGVTQLSIDAVNVAVATYKAYQGQPRQEVVDKVEVNNLLDTMFADTNNFLRSIVDPIVFSMAETQPAYVAGYRSARKHQPVGSIHTRLEATVTNELGEPFFLTTVTVNGYTDPKTGKKYAAKSATTDINGTVTVSEFQEGIRSVTVSGANVISKTFGPFSFAKGKATTKTFVCSPAFSGLPEGKKENQPSSQKA